MKNRQELRISVLIGSDFTRIANHQKGMMKTFRWPTVYDRSKAEPLAIKKSFGGMELSNRWVRVGVMG
jgi:hypothetical protein